VSAALSAPWAEGSQEPRFLSVPPAASYTAADDALEFIASVDIALDPWQKLCVRHALAEAADGRWAAFEFALLVARQNGKGEVIMALELAKLYLFRFGRPPLILHSAHLFPTAQEAFRRIREVIDGSDVLRKEIKRVSASHGEEGVELLDGARLRFMARTISGAGRGFSPTDVFFDEVFHLPVEAVSANLPALSAQWNPQIGYFASAGYPNSEVLWRIVGRGRAGGDAQLAYLEWSARREADLADQAAWLEANPGAGYRPGLTLAAISREYAAMPAKEFGRERLGIWADMSEWGVLDSAAWAARSGAQGKPDGQVAFALSASWPDAKWGSIAVAGWHGDEIYVQVIEHRRGTSWMTQRVKELKDGNPKAAFVLDDKDPAAREKPALERAGIDLTSLTLTQACQAYGLFMSAVVGDAPYLRHYDQPDLNAHVAVAQVRSVGDAQTWERKGPNICCLVAATHAAYGLAVGAKRKAPPDIF
jgi:hypothetical protein